MFTQDLLDWYKLHGRKLPWRQTKDPYKIMVSEFMLQQTQVSRVIPKYEAFLERFPTISDLAKAQLGDVIVLWSGLGYNRRAKFLWQASQDIVEQFNGNVPQTEKELVSLHGFGPYTANAVLAFAFNKPVVVIDANVKNVMNKVFGLTEKEIPKKVQESVPQKKARDFYNALMDIGSMYYKSNSNYDDYPFHQYCKFINAEKIPELKKYKQSTFKDSNRFYRGQILKRLSTGEQIDVDTLDDSHLSAVVQLVSEQMIAKDGNILYLK